jgi:hypothetical protein
MMTSERRKRYILGRTKRRRGALLPSTYFGGGGRGVTMGFSKKGKPCMALNADVADPISSNTTHAWPLSRMLRITTTSRIFPNCEKTAYRHFFISAQDNYSQITSRATAPPPPTLLLMIVFPSSSTELKIAGITWQPPDGYMELFPLRVDQPPCSTYLQVIRVTSPPDIKQFFRRY